MLALYFPKKNVKTIEKIFKTEFEKQEKNIANLISANLKTVMNEIRKTQDEIKKTRKRSSRRKRKP